jgi:hypothetical protein
MLIRSLKHLQQHHPLRTHSLTAGAWRGRRHRGADESVWRLIWAGVDVLHAECYRWGEAY